jgi:hypothetical protein
MPGSLAATATSLSRRTRVRAFRKVLLTAISLASSNDLFKATCATLFARMLDTVPNGVQLTEEVLPLPAKPDFFTLTRNFNGTLTISISARVRDASLYRTSPPRLTHDHHW